jgi:uncharacterized tellurite resistance protein B-like protein
MLVAMKPLELDRTQAPHALAALSAVALADGPLVAEEKELLSLHAEVLDIVDEAIPELDLDALATALHDPAHRAALVQRLVMMAMLDGELDAAEIAKAREIAAHLGVDEPAIRQMEHFLAGRMTLLAVDIYRRSFIASKVKHIWRHEGMRGMATLAKQARGKADPELAARYLALGELPDGTLGKELVSHFRRNRFPLPGEDKSAPEALLFHDVGHVLTGYGTDPEGEVEIAGFEAGYMREDGFSITVFVLYLFHLGADINPAVTPVRGRFSLEAFRHAYRRGARVVCDLRYWDPTPHWARPVGEVCAELGIAPTSPS